VMTGGGSVGWYWSLEIERELLPCFPRLLSLCLLIEGKSVSYFLLSELIYVVAWLMFGPIMGA